MKTWAEREVEIACRKENPNRKEGEFDYGCACYESALKAFNTLLEDGHSGMSIEFTRQILNRLIDRKPLTPIEDIDDTWEYRRDKNDEIKVYQCKRMSSLFKYVYSDGTVRYNDVHRYVGVDVQTGNTYSGGIGYRVLNEMFPITMPYMPNNKQFRIYTDEFLAEPSNGDFDTVGVLHIIIPDGTKYEVNRYFKYSNTGICEISLEEYEERKNMSITKDIRKG